MIEEKKKEKLIEGVLSEFDFDIVHKTMRAINWRWMFPDGELRIPNVYEIISSARRLLSEGLDEYYGEDGMHINSCGGFRVIIDGTYVELSFVLAYTDSDMIQEDDE